MTKKLITTTLLPKDINLKKGVISLLGSMWQNFPTECSAYFLCKMAKKHKDWRDFTKKEIDAVAREDFWFNKLISMGSIIENKEAKTFSFTDNFIIECYRLTTR